MFIFTLRSSISICDKNKVSRNTIFQEKLQTFYSNITPIIFSNSVLNKLNLFVTALLFSDSSQFSRFSLSLSTQILFTFGTDPDILMKVSEDYINYIPYLGSLVFVSFSSQPKIKVVSLKVH